MNTNELSCSDFEGVALLTLRFFPDDRGFFVEIFNSQSTPLQNVRSMFVQDNVSRSNSNVLRGLHFQIKHPQAKLICVLEGAIVDVGVDIRRESKTFGKWFRQELSRENGHQLFLPEGFAHGFYVSQGPATVLYKCTEVYLAEDQGGILWSDPDLAIDWGCDSAEPIISPRDADLPRFKQAMAKYF